MGCVGSPQPSPPNLETPGISRRSNPADIMDGILVVADPGTVRPAEGVVVLTNLDRREPSVSEPVLADGSFEISVRGMPDDEYRLQVRSGAARSTPFDFVGAVGTPVLSPAPRPLADCFSLEPGVELDFGEVAVGERTEDTVVLRNDCGEPLRLTTSFLDPGAPFDLSTDSLTLEPASSGELTVAVRPIASGVLEAVVFIEAGAPTPDRRPLTLFARAVD